MMKNFFALGMALCLIFAGCRSPRHQEVPPEDFTRYVDPYIGTAGHGHVFLGANVPFGLVQLGPANGTQGRDVSSGYHIADQTIIGFSHRHLSGTGIGGLCDISLMPVTGDVKLVRGTQKDPESGLYSRLDRKTEQVRPGYYAVALERYGINVELTATQRTGFHKYVFPQSSQARVVIDLEQGLGDESRIEGMLLRESDTVVSGYRYSSGGAGDRKIFFTAVFSKPMKQFIVSEGNTVHEGDSLTSSKTYGQVCFDTEEGEALFVKVALSPVSIENAKMNLESELPGWEFEEATAAAGRAWNLELNKIAMEASDEKTKRIFYTALFHTMVAPSVFCDVNGEYRGSDGEAHPNPGFTYYTTFPLWNTYRAAQPLMALIHPEKMDDIINTMLTIYREQGKLPVWHLMGCEADCMAGNPGISVVADAIIKGYGGFDQDLAYEAMRSSALLDERGLKWQRELGYIPYDKENETLSKSLEYAIADWALAQVAKKRENVEDYEYFLGRSKAYKRYFDKETQFMRGLSSDGAFRPDLNPFESVHRDNDYGEGNAWQYTWLVPHDVEGLVEGFEGKENFIRKLDGLFIAEGDLGEHVSSSISGMIGQYAHGNGAGHHILYLYQFVDQPWKTAEKVREVMETLYSDQPDGICGNESAGQMSAWYILSALGFYQVEPASLKYMFGSPVIDKATIDVGEGYKFNIIVHNNSPDNKYIESIKLNGIPYNRNYIDFRDMKRGGVLEFSMTSDRPEEDVNSGMESPEDETSS